MRLSIRLSLSGAHFLLLPTTRDAYVMTSHTKHGVLGLGEHDLLNGFPTCSTLETLCMVRIAAGSDSLVDDGFVTYATGKGTVGAKGVPVGEKEET
jgi:hypothetical protein